MAVHKAIRSTTVTQPQPQPTKRAHSQPNHARSAQPQRTKSSRRSPGRSTSVQAQSGKKPRRQASPQFKAQLFETFQQLNRGYGISLAALETLRHKSRLEGPAIFPAACLKDYRERTEELRALVNRDLLRVLSGHEEQDAARFGRT